MNLLEIENLNVTLGNKQIIKSISISLTRDRNLLISGKTGSGKTTLFKAILKMIPASFDKFIIFGKDYSEINHNEIGINTCFSFQEPETSFTEITVIDELNSVLKDDQLINPFIETFNFKKFIQMNPFKLSQAEKRILSLCGIFDSNKKLFLLDEPTSDLDPINQKKILEILKNTSTPKLIFSHDKFLLKSNLGTVLSLE
ncbi:MAG: energy-coupling factor ABC transporter ATP-binding protein [bacterium]|nr:energy-coupling factor ABC transporter ATP-binding protein [bacterium]